jgi:hypothetical protein
LEWQICKSSKDCCSGLSCFGGTCKNSSLVQTVNQKKNNSMITCTDTDSGMDYAVQGIVHGQVADGSEVIKSDYCVGNTLIEFYCQPDKNIITSINYPCPNECLNGACSCKTTGQTFTSVSQCCSKRSMAKFVPSGWWFKLQFQCV